MSGSLSFMAVFYLMAMNKINFFMTLFVNVANHICPKILDNFALFSCYKFSLIKASKNVAFIPSTNEICVDNRLFHLLWYADNEV